jgi:Mannosylglycerate hydrolase MGH1-like glycoside hydrolase domain
MPEIAELRRLKAYNVSTWRKWGPYLSARQWGTVREDFSDSGEAWEYFPHDQARSRAYRMGEDGIAGISDEDQQLCFAPAFWNGKDPILKERLFGLNNHEGNHGEDVKEYYFYLDNTPTHSYMKCLYKYPQDAFPYNDLVSTNRSRTRTEPEYELLDTGVFDDDRYFDIFIEYAKASVEDILIKITVHNRGREPAFIHVLPTFWFRNTWSWSDNVPRPLLSVVSGAGIRAIAASHLNLGDYYLYCENEPALLFTENETNNERILAMPNRTRYVKDAFDRYLIHSAREAVNPECSGTKVCAHYELSLDAGHAQTVRLRITNVAPDGLPRAAAPGNGQPFGCSFDDMVSLRLQEADDFYASITPPSVGKEEARIIRQSLAGMLWNKQYYYFDVHEWVKAHHSDPLLVWKREATYKEWLHMLNGDIISVSDKWEYPWYTSWDLAFNSIALSLVDQEFAKQQLELLLQALYLHPSGQMPASELNFGEITPPVHAWAAMFLYNREKVLSGDSDLAFLKRVFRKLMTNFNWWANQKDRFDKNVFEGGFLGLDNISLFDRRRPLPTGGHIEEADGTAWMALFCQGMLEIAVELAANDPSYQEAELKVLDYMMWIGSVVNRIGDDGLWDEVDGFYYDLLRFPDGTSMRLKVRSIVGLLPLCATTIVEKYQREQSPMFANQFAKSLKQFPTLRETMHPTGPDHLGVADRGILALVNPTRLKRILEKLFDENEFLSLYGIRSVSRYHAEHPYVFKVHGDEYGVHYLPGESDSSMFGGNTNWRGPIWFPINILIIRALLNFYLYYGDNLRVEFPTGSHNLMNLFDISKNIAQRLSGIFLPDEDGRRPVYGRYQKFQSDAHWRDYLNFFEYFNADTGAGLGASHQTGWTGLVAVLIKLFGGTDSKTLLETGKLGLIQPPYLSKVC